MPNSLLTFKDWTPTSLANLLNLALEIKQNPSQYSQVLAGKSIVGLFEKPSLRTRVSFDIGINKLGGHFVYVDSQGEPLKNREDPIDVGANVGCWADGIVARVFAHETLVDLDAGSDIPVINALCDMYHPCQALADYLALTERMGTVNGKTLAYVGDGNNVTHSLLIAGVLLGCHQVVLTPEGFGVSDDIIKLVNDLATQHGVNVKFTHTVGDLEQADAIYTDTWISMGDDTPLARIKETFSPYQVNQALMEQAKAKYVMHCQPAHRDLEITGDLMDSEQSLLMLQAENRMHAQNAIMAALIGNVPL